MPVHLLNPNNDDPDETHKLRKGTSVRIDGVPGEIIDRGYTKPDCRPVYKVIGDDNIERSFVENELNNDRVEIINNNPDSNDVLLPLGDGR